MDLQVTKLELIEMLLKTKKIAVLKEIKRILEEEQSGIKDESNNVYDLSEIHKNIIQERINSYKNHPDNLLDWEDIKETW